MSEKDDQYSEAETARRRDEVIRRMANTPPQPHDKPKPHRPRRKKPTASGRAARKSGRAGKGL